MPRVERKLALVIPLLFAVGCRGVDADSKVNPVILPETTPTASATATVTATFSPTKTPSPTPTATKTETPRPTATRIATRTVTPKPSVTIRPEIRGNIMPAPIILDGSSLERPLIPIKDDKYEIGPHAVIWLKIFDPGNKGKVWIGSADDSLTLEIFAPEQAEAYTRGDYSHPKGKGTPNKQLGYYAYYDGGNGSLIKDKSDKIVRWVARIVSNSDKIVNFTAGFENQPAACADKARFDVENDFGPGTHWYHCSKELGGKLLP